MTQPVIKTKELSKYYKKKGRANQLALDGLNLEIQPGEIYGFLGPNGAGKTTTIKLLLGFIYPDQGEISLLGKPASDVSTRIKIGYMPEIAYYYWYLQAGELLNIYGKICHIPAAERKIRITSLLEKVGLAGQEKTLLREFSKGMQQRFSLAQALLNNPEVLIFDEPASGLDPVGRRDIREIILDLHRQGMTIFFSSHELSAVELISTRVGILNKGKLVAEGTLEELLPESRKMKITLFNVPGKETVARLCKTIQTKLPQYAQVLSPLSNDPAEMDFILEDRDLLYPVLEIMAAEKLIIESVTPLRDSLEDLFMKIIKEGQS